MTDWKESIMHHLTDAQLLSLTRAGHRDAYGILYQRHHAAAIKLARIMRLGNDADDIAADAFAATLAAIRNGNGPTDSFTGYLFRAVRNAALAVQAANVRTRPTDADWQLDMPVPFRDNHDRDHVRSVLADLSPEHRELLWTLDAHGWTPAELADRDGRTPNGVSAMAYRARRRFRDIYTMEEA